MSDPHRSPEQLDQAHHPPPQGHAPTDSPSAFPALHIESLALRRLRNVARADLLDLPRFVVLSGNNGQGKTSVLEAVYLVCTTRSFRTAKLGEVVAHGADIGSVRAIVREGAERREQSLGLAGARRVVTLAGKRPSTLAGYAVQSPVVVFHPGEMVLSSGPAARRRTLLDRIALFVDPTSMDHLQRYGEAARSRQRALEQRGPLAADLEVFESLMAAHGSALTRARAAASQRVAYELRRAFVRITAEARPIEANYEPGGPQDAAALAADLAGSRERDRHRGSASKGPHRDDLVIRLGGHDVRVDASQGEHRAVTMALKMAELACIAEARRVHPVLLLDDVSSELDMMRTARLFELLRESPGQILLTTTTPELIDMGAVEGHERRDYRLDQGAITELARADFKGFARGPAGDQILAEPLRKS